MLHSARLQQIVHCCTTTNASVRLQHVKATNCLTRARHGNFSVYLKAILLLSLWQLNIVMLLQAQVVAAGSMTKGFSRIRAAKIANIHEQPAAIAARNTFNFTIIPTTTETANRAYMLPAFVPTSSSNVETIKKTSRATVKQTSDDNVANGKYEIHSVSGVPNYKSVNLTWEVEFVPAVSSDSSNDAVTNSSVQVEPPKVFQIFYCELQSFGAHRCRSKLVDERQHVEPQLENNSAIDYDDVDDKSLTNFRSMRHYSAVIDNLRMATKYSFHVRTQAKRRNMKISARSEIFGNEIDDESLVTHTNFGGQTIVVPTKGFTAEATKCLPHASEIEVETGPYFAGKIVVDGGSCGVKGDPEDAKAVYTMRIDHTLCKSLVKPETNTVETFITVQENLGIFTHSTRRFVVVCSYQSGMQTVRASFSVPGKDGVAAPVENDAFQPDEERSARRLRPMRYVDKSALILKENDVQSSRSFPDEESEALVQEVKDPGLSAAVDLLEKDDASNAVAILEDIVPGVNEAHIKHQQIENELPTTTIITTTTVRANVTTSATTAKATKPVTHARQTANYAKLVGEHVVLTQAEGLSESENTAGSSYNAVLVYFVSNVGSVLLLLVLTVILVACGILIAQREFRRVNQLKQQQLQQYKQRRLKQSSSLTGSSKNFQNSLK